MGMATLGSAMISGRAFGAEQMPVSHDVSLFLIDSSIDGAADAASVAAREGVTMLRYTGDIGAPWLDHLEPSWRNDPRPVIGVTFAGAFFCLEQLARSHGLVCTFRSSLPMTGQTGSLSPFVPVNRSIFAMSAGENMAIGALFSSVLRLAALPGERPRKAAIASKGEAGDTPLLWLLQPLGAREASEKDAQLQWGNREFS